MSKLKSIKNLLHKTLKYGPYIPFSNVALLYGQRWLSHRTLQRICDKRNAKIQRKLLPLINRINSSHISTPTPKVKKADVIWFCWFQGEDAMPPVVRLCYESLCRNSNGHEVVLLTKENYGDYVGINPEIMRLHKEGKIKQAHFADVMRINLLAQQGGFWIDATVLITRPLPEDIFTAEFFSVKTKPEGYFVSQCRWAVFALAAQRGNALFTRLMNAFETYLTETDIFIDYFMFDQFIDMLVKTNPEIAEMIERMPMNNPCVHSLNKLLEQPFDADEFARITAETFLFKLSWRGHNDVALTAPGTYFSHISNVK